MKWKAAAWRGCATTTATVTSLWPWLALAGLGALHGLSPANGWMFAAACGVRSRDGAQARRALLPIAFGHAASVALVAFAVAKGASMDWPEAKWLAAALFVGAGACWMLRARHAGIAIWSFLMASAHGAGLMLVPALVPICMADNPAREITASGSMVLALGAVAVHMAAMLLTTGVLATAACRGVALFSARGKAAAS